MLVKVCKRQDQFVTEEKNVVPTQKKKVKRIEIGHAQILPI